MDRESLRQEVRDQHLFINHLRAIIRELEQNNESLQRRLEKRETGMKTSIIVVGLVLASVTVASAETYVLWATETEVTSGRTYTETRPLQTFDSRSLCETAKRGADAKTNGLAKDLKVIYYSTSCLPANIDPRVKPGTP